MGHFPIQDISFGKIQTKSISSFVSTVYCQLSTVYILLSAVYYLLPTVFCEKFWSGLVWSGLVWVSLVESGLVCSGQGWSGLRHVYSCLHTNNEQRTTMNNSPNLEPSRFLLLDWEVREYLESDNNISII